MPIITYQYRLLPNKKQHKELYTILESQRILYNAALEEKISHYKSVCEQLKNHKLQVILKAEKYIPEIAIPKPKYISKYDQYKSLTELRKDDAYSSLSVCIQRSTLERLNGAFQSFFSRPQAGYPRFKSKNQWDSFGFTKAPLVKDNRIYFKGISGSLRFHMHRELPNKPLTAYIKRDHKGWFVGFTVEVKNTITNNQTEIGLDMGICSLATLSSGERIPNLQVARKAERKMKIKQRSLARCKRGSNRRKKVKLEVTRLHAKIANTRKTHIHQVTADLTNRFNTIYVEKLNVKNMVKNKHLARSIHDVAWGKFIFYLTYKAEKAGGEVIKVNPRYTSQICSGCRNRKKKQLSERVHSCSECGLVLDRDHNAALNIRARGCSESQSRKCSELSPASTQEYHFELSN